MRRQIDASLQSWAAEPDRRVLLLRGARQVGKTYSIRILGRQFENYVEINFEREKEVQTFFDGRIDPEHICSKLAAFSKTPIIPGKTLVFFDEVEACPPALNSLRYFFEEMPKLHVAAAGSLLEMVFSEVPSMGVGRLTSLFMYPMSFEEILWAFNEDLLAEAIGDASPAHPLDPVLHRRCIDIMRTQMMIGGLPAVVETYRTTRDIALCQKRIEDILLLLHDDFAKYRKRVPASRLSETFTSVARQSGGKFVYAHAAQNSAAAPYKDALVLLTQAHLVRKTPHSSARGLPLGGSIDERKFKAFLFDAGIHQRVEGLDISDLVVRDGLRLVTEGSLAEVYAGIELIAGMQPHMRPELYYWHRESRASNAEVDYLIAHKGAIVPIEVKAATRGAMQSMHLFLDEGHARRGLRLSQENFSTHDRFDTIPLYASGWVARDGR